MVCFFVPNTGRGGNWGNPIMSSSVNSAAADTEKRISRAVNLHYLKQNIKSVPIHAHFWTRPCLLHMMLLA